MNCRSTAKETARFSIAVLKVKYGTALEALLSNNYTKRAIEQKNESYEKKKTLENIK